MKTALRQNVEFQTRGLSKVEGEVFISLDGRELPPTSVLGAILDECVVNAQNKIKEFFLQVPERV